MTIVRQTLHATVLVAGATLTARAWEDTPRLRVNYLSYPVEWNNKTIMIAGRFQEPLQATGKLPAVILMHGTSGVSYRGVYYAAALNRAGIATFEIDQWGGRGLPGGAASRPAHLADNLGDIGGAYRLRTARPEIDASRIGILGSSMGGIQAMLMMTHSHSDAILGPAVHFQAAVAFYPVCWLYNDVPGADFSNLVDAPIRILVGTADDYHGGASACEALLHELAPNDAAHLSLRTFEGATHEFDVFDGPRDFHDPGANRRHGGTIHVRPDPQARQAARNDFVGFFAAAFTSG
jgi:dienelactone hydrolase